MDVLGFLYGTIPGRILLRPLAGRRLSALSGRLLDSKGSKLLIPLFIWRYQIDVSEYDLTRIHSFNDFFCRPLKDGARSQDMDPAHLTAPCDGLLTVHEIRDHLVLPVKQSSFTLETLLHDRTLAERYKGGTCLVFRLCVNHYHRYCYADSGVKSETRRIEGWYHTVRPAALENRKVFTENTREYTLIRSGLFGTILQMEIGAMLVGRIFNRPDDGAAERGREKGCFQYGGSTVLLLLEKGRAEIAPDILRASRSGRETPVRMGQQIGKASGVSKRREKK